MAAVDKVDMAAVQASCDPIALAGGGISKAQLDQLRQAYPGVSISFRPIRHSRIDWSAGQDASFKELIVRGDPDQLKPCVAEALEIISSNGAHGAKMPDGGRDSLIQQQRRAKAERKRQAEQAMLQGYAQGLQYAQLQVYTVAQQMAFDLSMLLKATHASQSSDYVLLDYTPNFNMQDADPMKIKLTNASASPMKIKLTEPL